MSLSVFEKLTNAQWMARATFIIAILFAILEVVLMVTFAWTALIIGIGIAGLILWLYAALLWLFVG